MHPVSIINPSAWRRYVLQGTGWADNSWTKAEEQAVWNKDRDQDHRTRDQFYDLGLGLCFKTKNMRLCSQGHITNVNWMRSSLTHWLAYFHKDYSKSMLTNCDMSYCLAHLHVSGHDSRFWKIAGSELQSSATVHHSSRHENVGDIKQ